MRIRSARVADLSGMLAIYSAYVRETTVSFDLTPPSAEAFAAHFRGCTAHGPWLVCEEDGELLGYAYAAPAFEKAAYAWCAELTIYLRPDAHGKGYADALYTELEAALQLQGYRVLIACITADNERSIAFHRRHGYTQNGYLPKCGWKFGAWHDVAWLTKRIGDLSAPQEMRITK